MKDDNLLNKVNDKDKNKKSFLRTVTCVLENDQLDEIKSTNISIDSDDDEEEQQNINQRVNAIRSHHHRDFDNLMDSSDNNSRSSVPKNMHDDLKLRTKSFVENNIKHTLMSKYESLEFDIARNEPYFKQQINWYNNQEFYFQIQLFIIGVVVAISGQFLDWSLEKLMNFKESQFELIYIKKLDIDDWHKHIEGVLTQIGISMLQGLCACIPVVFWFNAAAGGGIAEVKAQLNGVNITNLTTFKTGLSKLILTSFAVASGMWVGVEGPMIHVGAVTGAWLANMPGFEKIFPNSEQPKRFRNDFSKRDLLCCGAAAGVVAGFLSPMGGLMFALEEASTFWTLKMTLRCLFVSLVCGMLIQVLVGMEKSNFYVYNLVRFGNFENFPLGNLEESHHVVIIGIICGLMGTLWNFLSGKLMHWRFWNVIGDKWKRILEVMILCLLCCSLRIGVPVLYSDCQTITPTYSCSNLDISKQFNTMGDTSMQDWVENNCKNKTQWLSLNCEEGEYNPMATLFMPGQTDFFTAIFHNNDPFGTDNLLVFLSIIFPIICLLNFTAVPMGLFMPAMMMGSTIGRLYAEAYRNYMGITDIVIVNPGFQAMIGAAGMVTGITRLILTVIVIFYEITDRSTTCIPMLLALVISKQVADKFTIGIQDIILEMKQIPFVELEPHQDHTKRVKVKHVMHTPVVKLYSVEKASTIIKIIENTTHHGFPVIDQDFDSFKGVITKNQLVTLLNERMTFRFHPISGVPYQEVTDQLKNHKNNLDINRPILHWYKFNKDQESRDVKRQSKQEIMEEWVDLRPQVAPNALTLGMDTPIERSFELFRALGIRHLTCVDNERKVVGIITRKDIMSDQSQNLQ